jgi:hypothetical protein
MNNQTKILLAIILVLILALSFLLIDSASATHDVDVVLVEDIGFFNKGGAADHLCSVWCGRMFGFGVLMLAFAVAYGYYSYKIALIDGEGEVRLAEQETKVAQTQTLVRQPENAEVRIVPFNTRRSSNNGDDIQLTDRLSLPKKKLIEFITQSIADDGPGLAIGKWKKNGWDQVVLEQLLDYMHSIGLVTERANGRACEYTNDYTPTDILRSISNA